jgi:hypothetical protein
LRKLNEAPPPVAQRIRPRLPVLLTGAGLERCIETGEKELPEKKETEAEKTKRIMEIVKQQAAEYARVKPEEEKLKKRSWLQRLLNFRKKKKKKEKEKKWTSTRTSATEEGLRGAKVTEERIEKLRD